MSAYGIGGYSIANAAIPGYRTDVVATGYICVGEITLAAHIEMASSFDAHVQMNVTMIPRLGQASGDTQLNNGGC